MDNLASMERCLGDVQGKFSWSPDYLSRNFLDPLTNAIAEF